MCGLPSAGRFGVAQAVALAWWRQASPLAAAHSCDSPSGAPSLPPCLRSNELLAEQGSILRACSQCLHAMFHEQRAAALGRRAPDFGPQLAQLAAASHRITAVGTSIGANTLDPRVQPLTARLLRMPPAARMLQPALRAVTGSMLAAVFSAARVDFRSSLQGPPPAADGTGEGGEGAGTGGRGGGGESAGSRGKKGAKGGGLVLHAAPFGAAGDYFGVFADSPELAAAFESVLATHGAVAEACAGVGRRRCWAACRAAAAGRAAAGQCSVQGLAWPGCCPASLGAACTARCSTTARRVWRLTPIVSFLPSPRPSHRPAENLEQGRSAASIQQLRAHMLESAAAAAASRLELQRCYSRLRPVLLARSSQAQCGEGDIVALAFVHGFVMALDQVRSCAFLQVGGCGWRLLCPSAAGRGGAGRQGGRSGFNH